MAAIKGSGVGVAWVSVKKIKLNTAHHVSGMCLLTEEVSYLMLHFYFLRDKKIFSSKLGETSDGDHFSENFIFLTLGKSFITYILYIYSYVIHLIHYFH